MLAAGSLAGLIVFSILGNGELPAIYLGGFLLAAILSAVIIGAAASAGSLISKLLGNPVFNYLGSRSFALCLVHFPILLILNPATRTVPPSWWQQLLQLLIVAVAAEVFYHLTEAPANTLSSLWEKPGEKKAAKLKAQGWLRKVQLTVFVVLAALSLVVAGTLAFYPANWQQIAKSRAVQIRPELASASSSKSKKQESKNRESGAKEAGAPKGMKPVAKKVPRNLDTTGWQIDSETGSCNADVLIIGDSVTLGASADIKKVLPQAAVDGAVSRQIQSGRRYLPTTTTRGFILASWYMPWEPMRRCAVIYWRKT